MSATRPASTRSSRTRRRPASRERSRRGERMTETGPEVVDLPQQPVTKNGNGSDYLSPDEMEAGARLEERDVEDVFGGRVRVRELTAAQAARIQQAAVKPTRGGSSFQMSIADAEVLKFQL